MGDLLLVLTLVGIICGGIPILAVAYINGTLKLPGRKTANTARLSKPTVIRVSVLILGTTLGCFCFPVYNLTKAFSNDIRILSIAVTLMAYFYIGRYLALAFPYKEGSVAKTAAAMVGFNCLHIFAGMGCRYLLEFGETSNTYNFTIPNIILHLAVVNAICLWAWLFAASIPKKRLGRNNP